MQRVVVLTQSSCRGMTIADVERMHTPIARRALSLACTGFLLLMLGACSAPQLAYNNAPTLLRFKLYSTFDPTPEQDVMMSAALRRLHDWHRRHELPAYAEMLDRLATRVEAGLDAADIAQTRELAQQRYERLAAQALDEAIPILRTLNERNFDALRKDLQERNEDYAEEYLDGDEAARREAMVEALTEHVERWVDELNADQTGLLTELAARHPRFAELRLENRRHLQARALAALEALVGGEPQAEGALREVIVHWERLSLPQYREALRAWETDFRATLLAIERSLTPSQRRTTVANLREYSSQLLTLTEKSAAPPSPAPQAGLARPPLR